MSTASVHADNSVPIYSQNTTYSTNISTAEVHVSNDGRFLYASNRNLTSATLAKPGDVSPVCDVADDQPSDTIAVWSIGNNGTISRIQSAMAFGARVIRSFELSPPSMTNIYGGQDYVVAGSQITNTTYMFKRDRLNGTLSLVAQVGQTYAPATYLWL